MFNVILGIVIGWFLHLHYAEEIMGGIARISGSG
jgi:hypothetical protein